MKITGIGDLPGRIHAEKAAPAGPPAGKGFGEIFKQTLESSAAAVPSSAPAVSIQFEPAGSMAPASAVSRLEGFLDLLEGYCQKLSNPRVGLRGLEASLQRLEEGREALSASLGLLAEDDGLRDVLNQTLVTAEIEIMKFRRGDYLPV
jgi:hypothetical protein